MSPVWAVAVRPSAATIEASESIDVDVYDVIGDFGYGEGVAAKNVLGTLKAAKSAKQINVRINSGGGDAWDGIAIYNMLHQSAAKVVVEVDGIAASAASLIAMAGDEIRMAENALMMIHNPWSISVGEASDFRAKADELDKLRDALASTYMARTKRSREDVVRMMDEETWMTAEEAVEQGFATSVTPAKQAAAMLKSDLDLSRFKRVPIAAAKRDRNTLEIDLQINGLDEVRRITDHLDAVNAAVAIQNFAAAIAAKPSPAEPAIDSKEDYQNMANTTLAHALGLPVGASETDCLAAAARMRELEVQICAITGVESANGALGAIRGLKASADENERTKAELVKVKGERDRQNFDALIQRGQSAPVKLTPATAKLEQERFEAAAALGRGADAVAALKAYLDVAPTIIQSTPAKQPSNGASNGGASLAHNGKTYAELKPMEKHSLWKSDPELYRAMKDEHDAQVGV